MLRTRLTRAESAAARAVEPLAHLDYERELRLKEEAFGEFCQRHGMLPGVTDALHPRALAGRPAAILPSPRPRAYRTTTRRRARLRGRRLSLGFTERRDAGHDLPPSLLEPSAHTSIYRCILDALSTPGGQAVAARLNHVIVRGSYEAFSVILNLDRLNGGLVRRLRGLGERLQALPERVVSAFVFCDPSRSDYAFEREALPVPVRLKRLFGPPRFLLDLGGHRYALPPTSFAQVNASMVAPMLAAVRQLLQPRREHRLLDLYCGFGLFAHDLADTCAEVVGVDLDGEAIDAAAAHMRHEPTAGRVTFHRRDITAASLAACLPPPGGDELIILDPPRAGADPGAISWLAGRAPQRVVHICCGVETMPDTVARWHRHGYRVSRCLPLDMFAGTANLEVLLLFEHGE